MSRTINDILNEMGAGSGQQESAPQQEKVASASNAGSLLDFYGECFPGEATKVASMQKTAEDIHMTKVGKAAGAVFADHLDNFLFKFAAADLANAQADASVPTMGDPSLPVNKPIDAAAPISTDPQYYDSQLRQAISEEMKARGIENAYGSGDMRQGGAVELGLDRPQVQLQG